MALKQSRQGHNVFTHPIEMAFDDKVLVFVRFFQTNGNGQILWSTCLIWSAMRLQLRLPLVSLLTKPTWDRCLNECCFKRNVNDHYSNCGVSSVIAGNSNLEGSSLPQSSLYAGGAAFEIVMDARDIVTEKIG